MNQPTQPIIQHLFQAYSLENVSTQHLESFVEQYPCFGFGHYLLSRKLRAENADRFMEETQKTSLYFSNPFWLQWLLDNMPEAATDTEEAAPAPEDIHFVPGPAEEIHFEEPEISAAETVQHAEETQPMEEMPPAEEKLHAEGMSSVEAMSSAETIPSGEAAAPAEAMLPAETSPSGEAASAAELLLNSIEEARGLRESLQKINEEFYSVPGGQTTTHPAEGAPEAEPAEPAGHIKPIRDEEPPFILEEALPDSPPATVVAAQPENTPAPPAPAPEPSVTAREAPSAPTPDIIFEPYHTIDYFASQGIRLTVDENPTDPLGRQLKSFTDWLKVMRRLPQKEREIIPDRVAEQAIQSFAAHSVEGKEVLTETMAEVLAKQGMPERARIVYEKLSLLNPEKSTYFAAKIQQLNFQ